MKTLLKPLLAATLLSLTLGSVAMAKPNQGHDKPHHCMQKEGRGHHAGSMGFSHQPRFLRGIELTDVQKDKIFALTHAEVPKMRDSMKARKQLKKELMASSDNYSEAKVKTIADQLATIERDSIMNRARHHQAVLNILTPEQKKQVAENKEKFKQNHYQPTSGKVSKRSQQDHRHTAM